MSRVELPTFYYLENFKQLMTHVYKLYHEILAECDRRLFHDFCRLGHDAQALYVRFLARKGDYFRSNKIHYQEIEDLAGALSDLEGAGFIKYEAPIEFWVKLFNKEECCGYFPDLNLRKLKRADLDACIIEAMPDLPEPVLKVQHDFQVYRLLYFGNNHQDLSEFVLADLGLYEYESYPLRHGFIKSREELSEFLNFYQEIESYDDQFPLEFINQHQFLSSENAVLQRRLNKFYFQVGRQLERQEELELALEVYGYTDLAMERQARIYAKLKNYKEMERLCLDLLKSSRKDD